MQATLSSTPDPVEAKLRTFVEGLLGGKITAMHRLLRWRPAWNLELQRDGETLHLHIRGERGGDVSPFPELKREADILTLLGEQGVPVPRIYGLCEDPQAIVMELVPGSRDVSNAKDDAERQQVSRQWVEAMARMHQLPLQAFVEQGIELPHSAEDIKLAGLRAYYPLYARNKRLVKGVQWVSTLDGRTSAICRARDGQDYDPEKGPRPPAHPNCRSGTTPVLKSWREMGLSGLPPSTRASMNGQVAEDLTYDAWLRKQPVSFQDEVLGQRKGRLFRAGLKMDRFVNRAGDEYTLDELRQREAEIWTRTTTG